MGGHGDYGPHGANMDHGAADTEVGVDDEAFLDERVLDRGVLRRVVVGLQHDVVVPLDYFSS